MPWFWEINKLPSKRLKESKFINSNQAFDINCQFKVYKIEFERIKTTNRNRSVLQSKENDLILTKMEKLESTLQTILTKINRMEAKIDKLENKKDFVSDSKENELATAPEEDNKTNELKEWIISVFNNNSELGAHYVNIIVTKEGFEDIETFVKLSENDMKEIGIDKKGHRIKFMAKINEYNQKNAVAMSQMFDTEGV